jgi:hypothetical protein
MALNYTPVTSSQIRSYAYDATSKKLNIVFVKNGDEYQYQNVDQATFDSLIKADSIGSAFSSLIKKNPSTFPYHKV